MVSSTDQKQATQDPKEAGPKPPFPQENLAVRMKRIPEYITIYTGQVPQQRELDRFFSRHGHKPQ